MARYLEIVECFNADELGFVRQCGVAACRLLATAYCQPLTAYRLLLTAY